MDMRWKTISWLILKKVVEISAKLVEIYKCIELNNIAVYRNGSNAKFGAPTFQMNPAFCKEL